MQRWKILAPLGATILVVVASLAATSAASAQPPSARHTAATTWTSSRVAAYSGAAALETTTVRENISTRRSLSSAARAAFSWTGNYYGIAYGWDNDHAWAIGSYSAVLGVGAGAVAGIACGALDPDPIGFACNDVVRTLVQSLTAGSARLTNHGIWIAVYPHWGYITKTGGSW